MRTTITNNFRKFCKETVSRFLEIAVFIEERFYPHPVYTRC